MTDHPEDLPWNDAPADSDAPLGDAEPDPAEVSGDEDDPAIRDASLAGRLHDVDEYRRDTLDERLSEEEPDRAAQAQEPEAGELQAPESGDDDIALQRGAPALAARAYYEAARDSQDAQIARRATEVALFARQRDLALEAARLWSKLDPSADRAKQMVATLSQPGSGGDIKAELERVLAEAGADSKTLADAFVQLNQALAAQADKTVVYRLIVELAKPYPSVAEAQFAVALAGYNTGLSDLEITAASIRAADRALELKPDWERAALIKADLLAKTSPEGAIRYLNGFLASVPESRVATGALAQDRASVNAFAYAIEGGIFARDVYRIDASEPRFVQETLGGNPDPGSFAGGGAWATLVKVRGPFSAPA